MEVDRLAQSQIELMLQEMITIILRGWMVYIEIGII